MLDPVGSTSWHNRHLACFQRLNDLLLREATHDPTVMLVGPGGVTRAAAWLLNDSARTDRSRPRRLIGDAARYADQVLRRIPAMPLRSLEPAEIESTLSMPHRLIVVDRSQRILAAVARDVPQAECHCLDITFQPLPTTADVVIAFNTICRLDDPPAGMARVVAAVHPGGWLLIDDRSAARHLKAWPEFAPVAPKIHRRDPCI
ncbi:MAG: methyltransferase domain-containing protein [Phycisphaerae bacterium]|nr:methyltransferase domain-containing protein [Phycisphaerae bacterium]